MVLGQQIMQTIRQVREGGLACFVCNIDKTPSMNYRQDWRKAATTVQITGNVGIESDIGGLPVPTGVLIIDLDLYKGITREEASKALGGPIPWQQSLIQITQRGGEHHAFQVNFDISQRSNYPIDGLDLKVAGKGYICFGQGYTAANGLGVLRLLNISSLPELPIYTCEILKSTTTIKNFTGSINSSINTNDLLGALGAISPWCDRQEWLSTGMALKSEFGATQACFDLFDKWSRGDFDSREGTPENYDEKTQLWQWNSFRINGGIKIETIYYKALKNGWKPVYNYSELIGKLTPVTGTAPPLPVMKILNAPPLPNKILDVEEIPYGPLMLIPSHHLASAKIIIHHGLDNRVLRIDGGIRWWSGREWQQFPEGKMHIFLWECLPVEMDKSSNYNSIHQAFLIAIPRVKSKKPCKRIFFRNEVVNSVAGEVTQHDKSNLNYGTLSVDRSLDTVIIKWKQFLVSMFDSIDSDRVNLLQEIFGWCLISHNLGIEKYIAFVGVTRAGKGTVLRVLMKILGEENCNTVNFSTLGSPHSHETMRKYNVIIDLEAKIPAKQDRSEAAATLLKVTANESMSSRQFHKTESIYGPMNTKLVIACNKIPTLLDDSGASAGRATILLFSKSFKDKEQLGLYDELITELPGIVNWSIEGLYRLKNNNSRFTLPLSSLEQQDDLKRNSQPLSEFTDEYIIFDPTGRCFTRELHNAFLTYHKDTGCNMMSRKVFIRALKETLLSKKIKWTKFRIGDENLQGVIGLKIKYPNHLLSFPSPIPC